MKIAIINDTHFGIKNSADVFAAYQQRFFDELFFPYCIQHGIKKIIHMGDFYEHRKYINVKTLSRTRQFLLNRLRVLDMTMDIIPGNHDCYYKNTNSLCSLTESLQEFNDVVNIHMEPIVKSYDGLKIALLPWIAGDNFTESIDFVKNAKAPFLMAHLELKGFEMMKGAPVMSHGLNAELFSKYEAVYTGHYHTKSTKGNIHYFGTQYELSWADVNDPKYFHVFDTSTRKLDQIRNNISLFKKIIYNDNPSKKYDDIKGTFVKIIVTSKKDPQKFDAFVDKIQRCEPFDLKIVESFGEFLGDSIDDDSIDLVDTASLLNSYVDAIETDLDKDRIKSRLHQLYLEAQQSDAL
jgi:DNA repair exonuclease SbcCD nuclease subunit